MSGIVLKERLRTCLSARQASPEPYGTGQAAMTNPTSLSADRQAGLTWFFLAEGKRVFNYFAKLIKGKEN